MRKQISDLLKLGPLPPSDADAILIQRYEELIMDISPPVTDEEAKALVKLFGPDECYGLAWALVSKIETAPSWPIKECLKDNNEWIELLLIRAKNANII